MSVDEKELTGGKGQGRGWSVGCLGFLVGGVAVVVMLGVVVVIGFFGLLAAASTSVSVEARQRAAVTEVILSGATGQPKVAVIPVRGMLIPGGGGGLGTDPRHLLSAMLARAREDSKVRAVVLAVNSGGGGITTCDIMHREVQAFREETGKPVVALMEDVAASGAFYVTCASDVIYAHPTTITGSIGVMMPLYNASGLMRMIGVRDRSLVTGPYKDMTSLTAEKTQQEWEREKELLEGVIGQMHERFVEVIADGRPDLSVQQVRSLADGRIFTSSDAEAEKLIDAIGYLDDAVEKARTIAGVGEVQVVEYRRMPSIAEMILGAVRAPELKVQVGEGLPAAARNRPLYRWSP